MEYRRFMHMGSVEELRKKVQIYETILNTIHEGVLITDPYGFVVFYNEEIAVLEGLNRDDVIGKHLSEIYSQAPDTSEHLLVSQTSKPMEETYQRYFTREGLEVHLVATTIPVLQNGELLAVYSVCREVTHLKEMLLRTMQLQDIQADSLEKVKKQGTLSLIHISEPTRLG